MPIWTYVRIHICKKMFWAVKLPYIEHLRFQENVSNLERRPSYKGDDKFFSLITNAYLLNINYITYLKIKIN